MKKYESIVIDNDMAARMRLKTATTSVPSFGNVRMISTLHEAQSVLSASGHVDVIFISNRFPDREINPFIKSAKETGGGQDSAYILVLKTEDQESNTVAKNVLGGADGCLLEPYSVDQLVEITDLAARVKQERSQERQAAALRFLVQDTMKQLDRVWYLKSCGFDVGINMRKLKDMCKVFETLETESHELYLEIVVDAFEKAPLPAFPVKKYKGVSDRVKKRMEQKILAELEAEIEAEERVAKSRP